MDLTSKRRKILPTQLDYNLEVSYLWFNDNTSKPWYGNLRANLLVSLWFVDAVSQELLMASSRMYW